MKKTTYSGSALAALIGVSRSYVSQCRKRGKLVANENGLFDMMVGVNADWLADRRLDAIKKGRRPVPGTKAETAAAESLARIQRRREFADMSKRELMVKAMERKYLPIEYATAVYSAYLDTLAARLTTTAPDAIRKAGTAILAAQEINGEVIENFTAFMLTALHETKAEIQRRVETGEIEVNL